MHTKKDTFRDLPPDNKNLSITLGRKKWFTKGKIMRISIAEAITNTIEDLNKSGLVNEIAMKNIQSLCLPQVPEYDPEK